MLRVFAAAAATITLMSSSGCESTQSESGVLELRAADVEEHEHWRETHLVIGGSPVYMAPEPAVDASMVEKARPARDVHGRYVVEIILDDAGTRALSELTRSQQSRALAVIVDGEVVATPIVMTRLNREFVVGRLDWDEEDAAAFARQLNASR
jgi:preprotein translocase subunit SecD